jgi:sec-independent protein translocase protein TatA
VTGSALVVQTVTMGLENPIHILLLLVVVLLVFGAKRLPELGRSLGSVTSEFKRGIGPTDGPSPAPSASASVSGGESGAIPAPPALGDGHRH